MRTLKALTLHQPWATLVALGHKRIETRSWYTNHRGPLAIHAAASFPIGARELCLEQPINDLLPWRPIGPGQVSLELPVGEVVAVARLVDCIRIDPRSRPTPAGLSLPTRHDLFGVAASELALGDFTAGRYAWVLADVEPVDPPIPAKGKQQLWWWTDPR
jgi:hypothetical protein